MGTATYFLTFPSSSSVLVACLDKRASSYRGCRTLSRSGGITARTCSLWMGTVSRIWGCCVSSARSTGWGCWDTA